MPSPHPIACALPPTHTMNSKTPWQAPLYQHDPCTTLITAGSYITLIPAHRLTPPPEPPLPPCLQAEREERTTRTSDAVGWGTPVHPASNPLTATTSGAAPPPPPLPPPAYLSALSPRGASGDKAGLGQGGLDNPPRLKLYQILPPALTGRARVFENQLALKDEWVCYDLPYFAAPGEEGGVGGSGCATTCPTLQRRVRKAGWGGLASWLT